MLSESILINRSGNFTASENHRLMAGWEKPKPKEPELILIKGEFEKLDKKPLVKDFSNYGHKVTGTQINEMWAWLKYQEPPQGLITYAEEKSMEELFYSDPSLNFSTVHTRNGNERELECMKRLNDATGLDFVNIGDNQKHISNDGVGATPDGVVLDDLDLICTGSEVKCKSALVHAKNLLIENAEDLKEIEFEHFVQVQTQMLVTETDHWYFANYNPFAKKESMIFKYIIIGRDDDFIEILKKRIEIAKKIKADFLLKFKDFQ